MSYHSTRQLPVFVYGTLRPNESNYHLLAGRTTHETPAIADEMLLFACSWHPIAMHITEWQFTDATQNIVGYLMTIAPKHYLPVMTDLDTLEEYNPDAPQESWYQRVAYFVRDTKTGQKTLAWLYLGNAKMVCEEHQLIPDGNWSSKQ